MQYYVKDHTPKSSVLLVPYDMVMGGFRIHSDRSIVASARDVTLIGFDFQATIEWAQRIKDIEPFKVVRTESFKKAIVNALVKYHVDYIVFMSYYAPRSSGTLQVEHANRDFALFKVNKK